MHDAPRSSPFPARPGPGRRLLGLVAALLLAAAGTAQSPWATIQCTASPFMANLVPFAAVTAGGEGFSQGFYTPWFGNPEFGAVGAGASAACNVTPFAASARLEFNGRADYGSLTWGRAWQLTTTPVVLSSTISVTQPTVVEVEVVASFSTMGTGGASVDMPFGLTAQLDTPATTLLRRMVELQPGQPLTTTLVGSGHVTAAYGATRLFSGWVTTTVRTVTLRAYDGLSRADHAWQYLTSDPSQVASGLTDDFDRLLVRGDRRKIIAADGSARLLLHFTAPIAHQTWVTRLRVQHDGSPQAGGPARGLVAHPGWPPQAVEDLYLIPRPDPNGTICHWFAVYRAPDDFVRDSHRAADEAALDRPLTFTVEWQDPATQQWQVATHEDLRIRRAPIVLAHGLWSTAEVFGTGPFADRIRADARFDAYAVDYSGSNAVAFAENKWLVTNTVSQDGPVRKLLDERHPEGMAYARVDWVGHSMGGVLPRVAAKELDAARWRSIATFGEPPLHRLVLMDSPQRGSAVASVFAGIAERTAGAALSAAVGYPIGGGAVADLAEDSPWFDPASPTRLQALNGVPAHAITGSGIEALLAGQRRLVGAQLLSRRPIGDRLGAAVGALLAFDFLAPDELLYRTDLLGNVVPHDIVVHVDSQQAGLPGAARTDQYLVGSLWNLPDTLHTKNVQSDLYALRVIDLLHRPTVSPYFAELPGIPDPVSAITGTGTNPPTPTLVDRGPMSWQSAPASAAPGTTITLAVEPPAGFVPAEVLFLVEGIDLIRRTTPPWQAQLTVPLDAFASPSVRAFAWDGDDGIAMAPAHALSVPIAATVVALEPVGGAIDLFAPLEQRVLAIDALFSDGIRRRLRPGVLWPTLQVTDPGIAVAAPDGRITAVHNGATDLVLTLGSATATVPVQVHFADLQYFGAGRRGTGGHLPLLTANGPARVGDAGFGFDLTGVPLGTLGVVVLNFTPVRMSVFGIDLLVDPFSAATAQLVAATPAASGGGQGHQPAPIPPLPELDGVTAFVQAICIDLGAPSGLSASDGLAVTIH